jgi:hypothetical protein
LHAILLCVDKCEDVIFGTFENTFQDRQIRNNTARVEVLGAVEDDLIAF